MIITNKLTMDLAKPDRMITINAVQDDRYSRNLEFTLRSSGEAWTIPEDICATIRYSKADGTGGIYDTLPDGTRAWSIAGNQLTVALAPQVLTAPGAVYLAVTLNRSIHQISTFAVLIHVHPVVNADLADSEEYVRLHNYLPAPAAGQVGQYLRIDAVDEHGHVTAVGAGEGGSGGSISGSYFEEDGIGAQQNPISAESDVWNQWNSRLSFGMDPAAAPVPFRIGGQLLADGTIIAHNNGTQDKNRWGFHVFEAYAKDNYSRMTMLLDKHTIEAGSKPSLEFYYYIGSNHHAASYGNTKIGSDVAYHSFCFDRDKLTAYGAIDACMPITLARISLQNDLDTSCKTVAEADAAYEPELYPAKNNRCLKYIALRKAENGAMFYDSDRHQVVCKIQGQWCSLPFTVIEDPAFAILDPAQDTEIEWASGVIDGNGSFSANTARLYTPYCLPEDTSVISANDGYEFCLVPYTEGDEANIPNPYYDPSAGGFAGNAVYTSYLDLRTVSLSGYTRYRLIARRTDLADIAIGEGVNILVDSSSQGDASEDDSSAWANGVIDGNGGIVSNAARLYTVDYLPDNAVSVAAEEGYEFCVVPYSDAGLTNAPTPYYNPGTHQMEGNVTYYTQVDLTAVSISGFPHYRLIARRTDQGAIAPAEGSSILITLEESTNDPGSEIWENGVIDGNGVIQANNARLYTPEYISADAQRISAADGYEFCLIPYSDSGLTNAPIPYYNPATGNLEGSAVYYTQLDLSGVSISGYPNYKLIARRTDQGAINPSEGENIVIV